MLFVFLKLTVRFNVSNLPFLDDFMISLEALEGLPPTKTSKPIKGGA